MGQKYKSKLQKKQCHFAFVVYIFLSFIFRLFLLYFGPAFFNLMVPSFLFLFLSLHSHANKFKRALILHVIRNFLTAKLAKWQSGACCRFSSPNFPFFLSLIFPLYFHFGGVFFFSQRESNLQIILHLCTWHSV